MFIRNMRLKLGKSYETFKKHGQTGFQTNLEKAFLQEDFLSKNIENRTSIYYLPLSNLDILCLASKLLKLGCYCQRKSLEQGRRKHSKSGGVHAFRGTLTSKKGH